MNRIGAVGYLNARPLYHGLAARADVSLRLDVPAECARLLHAGDIDLGLVPAIELLRGPVTYDIVPGLAIGCDGPVNSVALFTRRPLAEVRRIADKNKSGRGDLSVQQAREIVRQAIASQPLPEQIRAYNSVVDTYGRNAGIGFFDEVVVGFTSHLLQLNQRAEAARAVDRARRAVNVQPNSQLATEFEQLERSVKGGK